MQFKPFYNLDPNPKYISEFVAAPYDVMTVQQAHDFIDLHPHSVLNITRPDGANRQLEYAKEALQQSLENNMLQESNTKAFYIYELKTNTHTQTGITGCVSCQDYVDDVIFTHEETRQNKVDERLKLMKITSCQTEPVILTYDSDNLNTLFDEIKTNTAPTFTCKLDDVEHSVWKVINTNHINKIEEFFNNIDRCYIADGHHRSQASTDLYLEDKRNAKTAYYIATLFPINSLQVFEYEMQDGTPCAGKLLDTKQALGIRGVKGNKRAKSTCFYPKLASGLFMRGI